MSVKWHKDWCLDNNLGLFSKFSLVDNGWLIRLHLDISSALTRWIATLNLIPISLSVQCQLRSHILPTIPCLLLCSFHDPLRRIGWLLLRPSLSVSLCGYDCSDFNIVLRVTLQDFPHSWWIHFTDHVRCHGHIGFLSELSISSETLLALHWLFWLNFLDLVWLYCLDNLGLLKLGVCNSGIKLTMLVRELIFDKYLISLHPVSWSRQCEGQFLITLINCMECGSLFFESMGPATYKTHFILKSTKVIHWVAAVLILILLSLSRL